MMENATDPLFPG